MINSSSKNRIGKKKPIHLNNHIFVFNRSQIYRIDADEIILISADENNRNNKWIITASERYRIRSSLGYLEEELNSLRLSFFRTHKSFLVNLDKVERIDRFEGKVYMESDYLAEIGKDRLKELTQLIKPWSV